MNDWNTWKWIIIPELVLLGLVIGLNIWRFYMSRKCKFESRRYLRKMKRMRVRQYKKFGYAHEEWFSYNYCFIERQRKLITALRDNCSGFPDLYFEELERIAKEDKGPSGLEVTPQEPYERWKAILSLMLYYLDRMDEASSWNRNPFDDEFYAVFISHEIELSKENEDNLKNSWQLKNDLIKEDIEKYKNRFFRLLSRYFFYMWD